MEVEDCTNVLTSRNRTESTGGSSDSELSEGWNIVDQLDAGSPEVHSSDGESVEVIDGEDDIPLSADAEVEGSAREAIECPSQAIVTLPVNEAPSIVLPPPATLPVNEAPSIVLPPAGEQMFDSSFRSFLFVTTFGLLVSQLAFMAAENVLSWNTSVIQGDPSFLRDLPTSPKSLPKNNLPDKVSWTNDEEVIVESVVDMFTDEPRNTNILQYSLPTVEVRNKNRQKAGRLTLKIDNQELIKSLKVLSNMTGSEEAGKKFGQLKLILDSLNTGIDDLEKSFTENGELNELLKKQRIKLNDVVSEINYGISRSLERLAGNLFNKIQNVETKFLKQLCKKEKHGYKYDMKGIINCKELAQENTMNRKNDKKKSVKSSGEFNHHKNDEKLQMHDYKYEVDKDSTGKVYNKEYNANRDNHEYYKLVEKQRSYKHKIKNKFQDNIKNGQKKNNIREELKHLPRVQVENRYSNSKKEKYKNKRFNDFKNTKKGYVNQKYSEQEVSKYFKEICGQEKQFLEFRKMKEEVVRKFGVSKELAEIMYSKFCSYNHTNKKHFKQYEKENFLNRKQNNKKKNLIIDPQSTKNILNFEISSSSGFKSQDIESSDASRDRIIEPLAENGWMLSVEETPQLLNKNKTDQDGLWFIKSGEFRSRVRWSHHRGDWWFDRSSQRRSYQFNYPHPPNWFLGRRKNWYLRRAWARQQCREGVQGSWCHLYDDTVTIPNSNFS